MNSMFALLRPYHWIKNLLVFLPLFFGQRLFDADAFSITFFTFVIFSAAASSVYIINDMVDRKKDAQHPEKKNRPIAAGIISPRRAWTILTPLLAATIVLTFFLVPQIWYIIAAYFFLNILYSLLLKHILILDIVVVSSFYLLRVFGGGVATNIPVSHWLVLCIFFGSLFLITAKRKADPQSLYPPHLLDHFLLMFLSLAVVSYSLYSILVVSSGFALFTVPLVLIGLLRYMLLTHNSAIVEYPEKAVFHDKIIAGSIGTWIVFMYIIFYL